MLCVTSHLTCWGFMLCVENMKIVWVVRKVFLILSGILLLSCLFVGYQVWQNNKAVEYPDKARINESLQRGVFWLESHRDEVLAVNNPILWWMVKESAELNHDPSLEKLFLEYKARYLDTNSMRAWAHMFSPNSSAPLHVADIQNLPDYNALFLYGLSCSGELAKSDIIKQQLAADFCYTRHHVLSPVCATHQMMGVRFMQRRHCDFALASELVGALQDRIVAQLTWDFRIVDVYFQRVLMLVDSGAGSRVKPIWISRVLDAQGRDGAWSDFQTLIPLGPELGVGFSRLVVGLGREQPSFHATAQGVLLMSLLLSQNK